MERQGVRQAVVGTGVQMADAERVVVVMEAEEDVGKSKPLFHSYIAC
jgi:hypothetical protein